MGKVVVRSTQKPIEEEKQGVLEGMRKRLEKWPSSLPISFSTEVRFAGLSIEGESGQVFIEGEGIKVLFPHSRNFQLSANFISVDQYEVQDVYLEGTVTDTDWSLRSNVLTDVGKIHWESHHPIESPFVFRGSLRGNLVSYQDTILGKGRTVLPFREFETDVQVNLEKKQSVLVTGKIKTDSFPVPYLSPMVVSPHEINLDLQIQPQKFELSLSSHRGEEKVMFDFVGDSVTGFNLQDIWSDLQRGKFPNGLISLHTQGFFWPLAGTNMPLNGTLSKGRIEDNVLRGTVTTPYGSIAHIEVDFVDTLKTSFVGEASPQEEWVVGWGRESMGYDSSKVSGQWTWGQNAKFYGRVFGAFAYGSNADTLDVFAELSKKNIRFTSNSNIRINKTLWPFEGEIYWEPPLDSLYPRGLHFQIWHPSYGKVYYEMPLFQKIRVVIDTLYVEESPYSLLKGDGNFTSAVTGEFYWDIERDVGHIKFVSKGSIYGEISQGSLNANWSPDFFHLDEGYVHIGNQRARVSGKFQLSNQHFYEVYKLQWDAIDTLHVEASQFNIGSWINLYVSFPLQSLVLNGSLSYSVEKFFQGRLEGGEWKQQESMDDLFLVKEVRLQGTGDTVEVSAELESSVISALNGRLLGRALKMNLPNSVVDLRWESPELKADWSGIWQKPYGLQGTFNILGGTTLPSNLGVLKDVTLSGDLKYYFQKPLNLDLYGENFRGTYIHPMVEEISWEGDVYRKKEGSSKIFIPSLILKNKQGQVFQGNIQYDFGSRPRLAFKGFSDTWNWYFNTDFYKDYKGYRGQINMDNLNLSMVWDSSGLQTDVRLGAGNALVFLEGEKDRFAGTIDSVNVSYFYPTLQQRTYQTQRLSGLIVMSNMDLLYDGLTASRMGSFITEALQNTNEPRSTEQLGFRPLELDLQFAAQGEKNYIDLDYLKAGFAGSLHMSGTYPIFLLNGEINSLGGELGLTDNTYKIEEFNIQWNQENTEQGRVFARAEKTMARTCNLGEVESCFLGVILGGTLENISLQYEGDCGDGLGESVDPRVIFSSISQDCYDGNKIDVNVLVDQGVSRILSSWVDRAGAYQSKWLNWLGHIEQCDVSGVQNVFQDSTVVRDTSVVVGSDVDNRNALYIGCKTKEFGNTGFRVGIRWGFIPNATEEWNEQEMSLEWKPKFIDNVQIDLKGKTHPPSNINKDKKREQELSLTAGLRYIYRFWEVW